MFQLEFAGIYMDTLRCTTPKIKSLFTLLMLKLFWSINSTHSLRLPIGVGFVVA